MKVFIICIIVAVITQEIRMWLLEKDLSKAEATLKEVIKIQKKETKLLERLYKDLLEREALYD